jgi:uncharacterized membrane protein YphA (DoxX/SURF4 family)
MSQTLLMSHASAAASAVRVLAAKLPEPKAAVTIPIIVIFAALVLIGLMRKVVALVVVAAIVCIGFLAYQSGAFNHWVDKGKTVIQQK